MQRKVHRLVLVLVRVDTKETIERWEFSIETNDEIDNEQNVEIDVKKVQSDIRNIIRQITASVTYLPLIENPVSFDILLYTDKNSELPSQDWSDSTSHLIPDAQEVELNSFNTKIHALKTTVSYKVDEL